MRRPTYTTRRTTVDLQLTPMIDCVFLLMIYFIFSSNFKIAELFLPSQLSAASGSGAPSTDTPPPPEADFEDVVVRILWQGSAPTWTVNDSPVPSLVSLKQSLAQVARIKRDAPVILHPDPDVPLGNVIEVYDISRLVGFEKIQFAASL
ncbi:MAG: biopolymer transporter ExbD [Planctomycetales bacterium]|nr:biopolymer transporter ExbD [Planctomycetales bacterium]